MQEDKAVVDASGGGGGGGQEDKANETGAITVVAPAMMMILNTNWSELSEVDQSNAVIQIGEAVQTSQCESSVMLAQLARANAQGLLPAPALVALTAAVSCAQTKATGLAVKQHVTRTSVSITDRLYKLLCARGTPGTGINQYDFVTDIFEVGTADPESIEQTLVLEYCVIDSEHPTDKELSSARIKIGAVLRKMKGRLIEVVSAPNSRNSVITVLVAKRDRAGGVREISCPISS